MSMHSTLRNLYTCFFNVMLLIGMSSNGFSQVNFAKKVYDLGVISGAPNEYLDIAVTNTSKQKIFIFRTDADKKFSIHYSSKTLLPDSTIYIRVAYNPDKTGDFSDDIKIHFSCFDTPYSLTIQGFVAEMPRSSLAIDCPSFDRQKPNTMLETDYTIKVIDSITRQPLPESVVKIISNGLLLEAKPTNEKGILVKRTVVGYYYFVATKEDYFSNDAALYVNRNTKEITIALLKKRPIIVDEPLAEIEIEPAAPVPEIIPDNPMSIVDPPEKLIPSVDKYPDFPEGMYKPNNIVFVIDISSSMKVEGRMDLLKASMIELTKMLRDIDKLTIIAYSNKATILFDTQFVTNKDSIVTIIKNLEASGITDGGKGMKLGYEKAHQAYITGGNNQVIMTTDGAFNTGGDNIYTMAQKNAKKGVDMSIVGIKMKEQDKKNMYKISELGNGNFIEIRNYDATQTELVNEIRFKSKRK